MKNLMFDLETLGRKPGCGIIEIGWCCFSSNEYKVSAAFGHVIPVEQNLLYGFRKDTETMRWWLETQGGLPQTKPERARITMPQVLSDVASQWNELWFAGVQRLWSKPSLFDIPILKEAFDMCGVERPIILREENWHNWRDMMTICDIEHPATRLEMKATGTAHRAKDDALAQARRVSQILALQQSIVRDAQNLPNAIRDAQMYNGMYLREKADLERLNKSVGKAAKSRGRKQSRTKSRKR